MKSVLETTYEITKLVNYSPRRGQLFDEIKDDIAPGTPGVRVLCPTRWTVRADSMLSIIQSYTVLNELWDKACNVVGDTETIAHIRGAAAQMGSFEFFFGLVLGEMLLRHTDNLSRTLQHDHVSAAEGQAIATMTTATLASLRNDGHFDLFWEKVQQMASERDVNETKIPWQRKHPAPFEEGMASPEFHTTVKEFYRHIYYEALDLIVESIRDKSGSCSQ